MEIWKDIKGFEGCYKISNLGRVESLEREVKGPTGKKRLIEGRMKKIRNGKVQLDKNGAKKERSVNRLLFEHFDIPIPPRKRTAGWKHKETDKVEHRHVKGLKGAKDNLPYNLSEIALIQKETHSIAELALLLERSYMAIASVRSRIKAGEFN